MIICQEQPPLHPPFIASKAAMAEAEVFLRPWSVGDSLLFAAGAFAALGSLNLWAVCGVFISAAIIGDAVNYAIGNYLGGCTSGANISSRTPVLAGSYKCGIPAVWLHYPGHVGFGAFLKLRHAPVVGMANTRYHVPSAGTKALESNIVKKVRDIK